jgi:hypothetical protein
VAGAGEGLGEATGEEELGAGERDEGRETTGALRDEAIDRFGCGPGLWIDCSVLTTDFQVFGLAMTELERLGSTFRGWGRRSTALIPSTAHSRPVLGNAQSADGNTRGTMENSKVAVSLSRVIHGVHTTHHFGLLATRQGDDEFQRQSQLPNDS